VNSIATGGSYRCVAKTVANAGVSKGLIRLDLDCDTEIDFEPGQFAMLNLVGAAELVFSRPLSIFAAEGTTVSFLYRVVGRGTALLAGLKPGDPLTFLGPLGRPFPAPRAGQPTLLLAGGVGLPPLHAWWRRHGPEDGREDGRKDCRACFGARDGHDVPWSLLPPEWRVSVDHHDGVPGDREAFTGLVIDLARRETASAGGGTWSVLSCGPMPMLRAAAAWAAECDWPCLVSVEEHMGCGYGVCKGCVVPLRQADPAEAGPRHATSCQEGPVFASDNIDWNRFGA